MKSIYHKDGRVSHIKFIFANDRRLWFFTWFNNETVTLMQMTEISLKYNVWRHREQFYRRLKVLKLYWLGKLLISNPWSFEYTHDRQEQRVDSLFTDGHLDELNELELSGFYQTVVDKTVQLICTQHLSSLCVTSQHLRKVRRFGLNGDVIRNI